METRSAERKLRKNKAVGVPRVVRQMPELMPFLIVGQGEHFVWVEVQKEDGMRRRLCYIVSLRLNGATALLVRKVPKGQVKALEALKGTLMPDWPGLFSESLPVYLVQDVPALARISAAGTDRSPKLLCVGCLDDGR